MSTPTQHDFPLATSEWTPADGIGTPDGEGNGHRGPEEYQENPNDDKGGMYLPQGALIAIIVVAALIAVVGISTAILFYVAKKREWKMREKFRQSARKVVNALTPRRSEFPKEVKDSVPKGSKRGIRLDDVPPTPRLRPEDVEKGLAVTISSKGGHKKKWGR